MNRNKNPLNVKQVPDGGWKGSVGADDRGHAVFEDPAYGIRAAMRCFQRKFINGKRTIRAIVFDWAPVDDTQGSVLNKLMNDPEGYSDFVAARAHMGKEAYLPDPVRDPATWTWLLRAMAQYEMGESCPWGVILAGVGLWFKDFGEEGERG